MQECKNEFMHRCSPIFAFLHFCILAFRVVVEGMAAGGDPKVGRPGGRGRLFAGWLTAQGEIAIQPNGRRL